MDSIWSFDVRNAHDKEWRVSYNPCRKRCFIYLFIYLFIHSFTRLHFPNNAFIHEQNFNISVTSFSIAFLLNVFYFVVGASVWFSLKYSLSVSLIVIIHRRSTVQNCEELELPCTSFWNVFSLLQVREAKWLRVWVECTGLQIMRDI